MVDVCFVESLKEAEGEMISQRMLAGEQAECFLKEELKNPESSLPQFCSPAQGELTFVP